MSAFRGTRATIIACRHVALFTVNRDLCRYSAVLYDKARFIHTSSVNNQNVKAELAKYYEKYERFLERRLPVLYKYHRMFVDGKWPLISCNLHAETK